MDIRIKSSRFKSTVNTFKIPNVAFSAVNFRFHKKKAISLVRPKASADKESFLTKYLKPIQEVIVRGVSSSNFTETPFMDEGVSVNVVFDNTTDRECTVVTIEGKNSINLLVAITGAFLSFGLIVVSASIQSNDENIVNTFRVKTTDGHKIPEADWKNTRQHILSLLRRSNQSHQPAMYGIVAAAELERLRSRITPSNDSSEATHDKVDEDNKNKSKDDELSKRKSGSQDASDTTATLKHEVDSLEFTAAEMAAAAAELVAAEREIVALRSTSPLDERILTQKEGACAELRTILERNMSAMSAALSSRRRLISSIPAAAADAVLYIPAAAAAAVVPSPPLPAPPSAPSESAPSPPPSAPLTTPTIPTTTPTPQSPPQSQPPPTTITTTTTTTTTAAADAAAAAAADAVDKLLEPFKPAVVAQTSTGPGCGSGSEILLQAFNWESHKHQHYRTLTLRMKEIAVAGFTSIWLPPPSESVSPQGYLPKDLYCLDSAYGSESELRQLISLCHQLNVKAIADIVINHRCASHQGHDHKWNKFGGRLSWEASAICSNNPAFGGRGGAKQGDDYTAAPNIDHSQERIRKDLIEWLRFLRHAIGFDGWRFDFVRGYPGHYCREYIDATVPEMAFGEYWDSCEYNNGVLEYNQDRHRQRTVDWCDHTGGTAAAFDFTTKGILQEAVGRREYWRLVDGQGRPPGLMGMWSSRAITFIDNHDTGSTLGHWPYPVRHLQEGYAYLLTHPGTPCVFYDHF
eukprot:CAMPEP_0175085634 /NCGR_PEP_ID=MMETSP0052_2-20121109/28778_1 /TAXON_ID=51329 ORGANISM="Polytomella parva, Strain SAG 63-3" /NCGR_SAMPLE_ID=MMETSP0052_2 /ASSEMBLY_ACC=CAM_ASM_000194 /LENGTH=746 /DNA_ID=CAMNT_0016357679 /DNA_START=151 /DNA_END=2387 /DNA_ORIENTATION=-